MSVDIERTPEEEAKAKAEHDAEVKHCRAAADLFFEALVESPVSLAKLIQRERSEAVVQKLLAVCEEHDARSKAHALLLEAARRHVAMGHHERCGYYDPRPARGAMPPCTCGWDQAREALKAVAP